MSTIFIRFKHQTHSKDYKEELYGLRTTIKDTVNLRHGRRTNNYKDYKEDYKDDVTFATGGGLTSSKD